MADNRLHIHFLQLLILLQFCQPFSKNIQIVLQTHLLDIELGCLYFAVQSFLNLRKIVNLLIKLHLRSIIDFLINLHYKINQPWILLLLQQLLRHSRIASSFEVELQTGNGSAFDDGFGKTGSFG